MKPRWYDKVWVWMKVIEMLLLYDIEGTTERLDAELKELKWKIL